VKNIQLLKKTSANSGFMKWRETCLHDKFLSQKYSILVEKNRLRSSPLHEAAKRQAVKKLRFSLNYSKKNHSTLQKKHPKHACF
jgi:hypothetical protein